MRERMIFAEQVALVAVCALVVGAKVAEAVRTFVDYYRDFWLRQPVSLYEQACDELAQFNASLTRKTA